MLQSGGFQLLRGQAKILSVKKTEVFLFLIFILSAGNFVYEYKYLRPSDDYFWLMFISNNFIDAEFGESLYARYSQFVHSSGYSEDAVARADVRQGLDENYLLQGLFFVPFVHLAQSLNVAIEAQTILVMFGGFISMYVVTSGFFLLALWRCRDATLVTSFLAAAAVIYFVDFLPRPQVYHYLHPGVLGVDLIDQVKHFFARIFHPGPKYVIFNFAPKDRLAVLVAAMLLLRWNGHVRAFYLLFPVLFLVHREYSGLLIAMFVAIDLLVRPRLVLGSWIGPFAGIIMATFMATSVLGQRAAVSPWIAVIPIGLSVGAFLAFRTAERLAVPDLTRLLAWQETTVNRVRAPSQDMLAFGAIWLMLLPLTYLLYATTGQSRDVTATNLNNFLWLWIPTRYLGLFAFPVLAVWIWWVLRFFRLEFAWTHLTTSASTAGGPRAGSRRKIVAVVLALAVILMPAGRFAIRQGSGPIEAALEKTRQVEAALDQPLSPENWHADETRVYYGMFTSILSNEDRLARMGVP